MANAIMANAMLKPLKNRRKRCTSSLLRIKLTPYCRPSFHDVWAWAFNSVDVDTIRTALMARGITGDIEQALLAGHGNHS